MASAPERTGHAAAVVRLVWTLAFLAGAFTHARAMLAAGWLPAREVALGVRLFWSALLPLDLAVAALLWWRPALGAWLGMAVMLADVLVNSAVVRAAGGAMPAAVQLQILFLGFLLGSAPLLLDRDGR